MSIILFLNSPIHTIEEEICFDDTMPSIYDDYNDDYECVNPTITDEKNFAYVESNNIFMMMNEKNALCDSYIVEFAYDATESFYERRRHDFIYLNNTKSSLFILKLLKFHLFYPPMLLALCFNDLFSYKIPMHRKRVRLKSEWFNVLWCVPYALMSYSVLAHLYILTT